MAQDNSPMLKVDLTDISGVEAEPAENSPVGADLQGTLNGILNQERAGALYLAFLSLSDPPSTSTSPGPPCIPR